MKKILLVALAAITLASCAKNEAIELNDSNAISFRAWTSNAARTVPTVTDDIKDDGFAVWAYTATSNKLYMNDVDVTWQTDKYDYSPHQFWPAEPLNFYAISPAQGTYDITDLAAAADGKLAVNNFVVNADVTKQIDLLYAVNMGEELQETAVQVTFDHALAQVSFKAKSTNTDALKGLEIIISGVEVAKVNTTGNFVLPQSNTNVANTATPGVWTPSVPGNFVAGMAAAPYTVTGDAVELTSDAGRLLMIPQTTVAYDPADGKAVDQTGSYFLVNCTVKDNTSGIFLWAQNAESGGAKPLAIPFDAAWESGKHYVYTFIFGEGAGYDPEDGDDVLVPIKFEVASVDSFAAAEDAGEPAL